jgi:hypothetical protein
MPNITRSRYDSRVLSGTFRRLKFPFKMNEMALISERYSDGVGIKLYRRNDTGDSWYGMRRLVVKALDITSDGMTFNYVSSCASMDIDATPRQYHLKIIGIDMEI